MANRPKRTRLSDADLFERVQSILINAAEGQRSIADDRAYKELKGQWRKRDLPLPHMVATHPTVDSIMASLKGLPSKRDRVGRVREDFIAVAHPPASASEIIEAVGWTGSPDRVARLRTVKTLLPLAQSAVESMIATLSEPNPNGGPLLDEREDALKHLRELHHTLGEYLLAVEAGHLDDDLGQGLAAESARYAKRAAHALRSDPMPYLASALLLGIFSACDMPGIGGYLGGVALTIQKHVKK
jgi:hypothetical protein